MHIFTSGRPSAAGDALMRMARATLAGLTVLVIGAVGPVMAQTGDGNDPDNPSTPAFGTSVAFKVGSVLCKGCDGAYDLVMINLKMEEEGTGGSSGYTTNFGSMMDSRQNGYIVFKEGDDQKDSRVSHIESVFIAPGATDTEKANDHQYLQTGRLSPDAQLNDDSGDLLLDKRVAWKIPDALEFSKGYEMVLRLRQGHGYETGGNDTIEMITLSGTVGDLKQTTITHIYFSDWTYDNEETPLILTSYVDAGGDPSSVTGTDCADTGSRHCETALLLPTGLGVSSTHIGNRTDSLALKYTFTPDLTATGPTASFMDWRDPNNAAGPTLRIDRVSTDLRDIETPVHTATFAVSNSAIEAGDARRLRGANGTISNTEDLFLTKEIRVILDTDTPSVCRGDDSATFTQLVRNRLVYADELIGTNQTTLQYPSDTTKRPTYEIVARRTIDPGNAGDVTISLQGATFGEDVTVNDVRFIPAPGGTDSVSDTSKITIAYQRGGLAGESEVVFNFGVSAFAGTGEAPANHRIRAGDRFVISLPELTQVNLDQSEVTIGSTLLSTQISGNNSFPDGLNAISRCVSDRQSSSARSCIYAKTVSLVDKLNLGPAGRDTVAYIDNQDRTKFAQRGPVVRMSFPPGFNNNGSTTTTHTNVLSMGTVTFNGGPIPSYPNPNACSDPFLTDNDLQPLGKDGNPYRFGADDKIVVTLEPNPTGANGLLLMKRTKDINDRDPGTAVEIIPASANGFAEIDLGNPDNISGEWEFFFMPGFNEMRYGETRSMMAEVRFGDGDYMNLSSSPSSRVITLTVDGIGTKALAYALPPPQSPDESFIRIRCEDGAGRNNSCQISLECFNHVGNSWFADVSNAIPSGGVAVMNRADISGILAADGFNPATDWGGDAGRLSCQIYTETDAEVSTQVLVRSGGSLTNNTFVDLGAN
ncbi:hypothetical protein [Thioalkalivibrio sp. HK1]|uniref:hypothetical protein n=1 Tax=Thioalkalivibrio sp. HK1 TaxID=1469245 RepID=UPI000470A5BE|nr:hypothetical protein [Thioalkalivibrio sp. HK1]